MTENPFSVLAGEAVPDSRVRVDDVIAAGRVRVRRRRGAVAAGCAAAVVLVTLAGVAFAVRPPNDGPARPSPSPSPSVSAHPSGCTVARVDVDGDIGAAFTDPSGRYVAFSRAPDPGLLIVYRDGVVVRRYTTGGRLQTWALNASGTAVGAVDNDAYRTTTDGALAMLPRPSGAARVWAYGINAAGDVVGEAAMPGKKFRAVLWRHTALDAPVLLPTPSGQSSSARGITDDGRVLGDLDQGATPYLWNADGTGSALPTPPGMPGGHPIQIAGDWVTGMVNYLSVKNFDPTTGRRAGTGDPKPARWQLSSGTVEILEAEDVFNGSGRVAADGTLVINRFTDAVFWDGTRLTPLPAPPGYDHVQVTSISADGRVIGGAATKNTGGSIEPFRWDCRR
ncbi:hypothetical protein ACFO1B_28490 [Dactylosporangium siamense]|uniref:Uncharacterized protein n=1 Tax=Dactylosporangium siamense TaxID=685454 RepID=A0A919PYM4_9ACTN|nr:hypothetical protein [Dactylosporangium siamense]GIG50705.1 hypothetical protein Dsi01nite_087460 [Dactylosporangium siamense]